MVPAQVRAEVKALVGRAESGMGMPEGKGGDAERLRTLVDADQPVAPELY